MATLPSLNTLRVFEAAAWHRSFTRASAELHVTQVAISRQVRRLESTLSKALFVRLHRTVELTPIGARLAENVSQNFAAIGRVLDEIRSAPS